MAAPGLDGLASEPFARRQARQMTQATRDKVALVVLVGGAFLAARGRSGPDGLVAVPLAHLTVPLALLVGCIVCATAAPGSWQRWRVPLAAAVRLAPLSAALALPSAHVPVAAAGYKQQPLAAGDLSILRFLFSLVWDSGTLLLAKTCLGMHLPPVLSALLQLLSTAAVVAGTSGAACSTAYIWRPETAARLDMVYVWLEPLIAPLEPLLWLLRIGASHPQRRCHGVVLAFQIWGGLVAPLVMVAGIEGRAYRQYRLQRLRQYLLTQRRFERDEHRRWTRAAAANRRWEAQSLGLSLSDISTSSGSASGSGSGSSSEPDTPRAAADTPAAAAQAEALLEAPAPPGLLLPGDWQYEVAYQVMLRLRQLTGRRALPLGAAICLLYAWHVLAYPW